MTRWNETHDDEVLGSCGCRDYHMADCPLRTGTSYLSTDDSDFTDDWYGR